MVLLAYVLIGWIAATVEMSGAFWAVYWISLCFHIVWTGLKIAIELERNS